MFTDSLCRYQPIYAVLTKQWISGTNQPICAGVKHSGTSPLLSHVLSSKSLKSVPEFDQWGSDPLFEFGGRPNRYIHWNFNDFARFLALHTKCINVTII